MMSTLTAVDRDRRDEAEDLSHLFKTGAVAAWHAPPNVGSDPMTPPMEGRRSWPSLCVALAIALAARIGHADSPAPPDRRTEVGGLPVVTYDSDTGLLVAGVLNVAHFEPHAVPYAYRVQLALSISFKATDSGLRAPLDDDEVVVDVPGLLGGVLRMNGTAYFRRYQDAGWYGAGGDTRADVSSPRFYDYSRVYPGAAVNARRRLAHGLELLLGAQLEWSEITPEPGGLLNQQLAEARGGVGPDAAVLSRELHGADPNLLGKLRIGLLYDTRDNEFLPTCGTFVEIATRLAPFPASLRHAGFFASAAGFVPLGDRLVLGGRLFGDLLVGNPPFYALSEAGVSSPFYAPGGASSLRGVLLQRFAGKIKFVANGELRAAILRGVLLQRFAGKIKFVANGELRAAILSIATSKQRIRIGAVAFTDAARTMADWYQVSIDGRNVDGPWTRIAVGVGGGLRVAWGETFVIRADVGYSPTEQTQGVYVGAGQVF